MNDLAKMLRDAVADAPQGPWDVPTLLEAGRRRVRHRRMIASVVAAAVVLGVVAGLSAVLVLDGHGSRALPAHPTPTGKTQVAPKLGVGAYPSAWQQVVEAAAVVGPGVRSAAEANKTLSVLGFGFVRYETVEGAGTTHARECAVFLPDKVYVALVHTSGSETTVLLGPDNCSFDPSGAAVVGTVTPTKATWTKGADLMLGVTRGAFFGAQAKSTPAAKMAFVVFDANRTGDALQQHYILHMAEGYPSDATKLLSDAGFALTPGDTIERYEPVHYPNRHQNMDEFSVCVVNTDAGDYALYESSRGKIVAQGAGVKKADLPTACHKK